MKQSVLRSSIVSGLCAISVILLNGCSTVHSRIPPTVEDIASFQINCAKQEQQLKYLYSIMPTRTETDLAALNFLSFSTDSANVANGRTARFIQDAINDIYRRC